MCYGNYRKKGFIDGKFDFVIVKAHTVNSLRIVLIGRTGIVRKTFTKSALFVFGYFRKQLVREFHLQGVVFVFACIPCGGVRVTICKGQVGFDIKNGRSVQKIRARNDENEFVIPFFCLYKLHARQPDRVGTEGGAACEHTHARITTKTGRTDGGRPFFPMGSGKIKQQPKVGKAFYPTQGFFLGVFGFEYDFSGERRGSAALAWNAEFFFEITADIGDWFYQKLVFHNKNIILRPFLFVKWVFFL